ncbi:MAG: hypothetical protein KF696_15185 [Planctomycetes bacterium]|nr:hypothetical protein [Planctomycetota bacterium]MCW8136015.1 hypothetical protein [Planctomycetota bacterium]
MVARLTIFTLLALLAACQVPDSSSVRVTPAREYRPERRAAQREPVILIPGSLGSRLYNKENGEVAWGSLAATISDLTDDLDLPIHRKRLADNRDNLLAYRVLDRAEILAREGSGEVAFYASLIQHLEDTLGYRPAYGRKFYRGHDLFVFYYDWRRSNVEAAVQLGEFIADIRRDLNAPNMKFTFLAVSNGGVVARYYLRYGSDDQVSDQPPNAPLRPTGAGARDCKRLICLGTPHMGTLDALQLIHEGYAPNVLARRYPPATIFSFPAAFELLPDPGEKIFVGDAGETLDLDLWKPEVWPAYGLSVFGASERARLRQQVAYNARPGDDREALFEVAAAQQRAYLETVLAHAMRLKLAIAGPCEVPLHVILGVTTPTLARVGMVKDGDEWELYFRPRVAYGRSDPMTSAMYALGDGVVTRRSGLGEALSVSDEALLRRSEKFRESLAGFSFTPFTHRAMFEDQLLRLTLAELLSTP